MYSQTFINYHIFTWKLCGIWHWPLEPKWYTVYSYLNMFIFHTLFVITLIVKLFNIDNVLGIIEILQILPSALAGLKCAILCYDKKLLLDMFQALRELDDQRRSADHHRMGIYGHRYFPLTIRIAYLMSCAWRSSIPILTDECILVWNSSWPFDYANSAAVYYAILFYQMVATYFLTLVATSTDIFSGTIYGMVAGHLRIVAKRMAAIGWQGRTKKWTTNDKVTGRKCANNAKILWQRQCEAELQECLSYHLKCLKFVLFIYLKDPNIQLFPS